MGMEQAVGFNTHNLRIKIPVQKDDMYISDQDDISTYPLPSIKSYADDTFGRDTKSPLCRKPEMGLLLRIYYLFARCFE
jgi:hypothetical protein